MKPASGNPKDCHDLETLREWIADLQEVASIQRELVSCSRKQVEIEQTLIELKDQKMAALEEQNRLLKDRVAQYEIAFSVNAFNHVRRLN